MNAVPVGDFDRCQEMVIGRIALGVSVPEHELFRVCRVIVGCDDFIIAGALAGLLNEAKVNVILQDGQRYYQLRW